MFSYETTEEYTESEKCSNIFQGAKILELFHKPLSFDLFVGFTVISWVLMSPSQIGKHV